MITETDAPEGVAENEAAPEIDPIDAHNPPPAAAGDDTTPADDAGADTVEGGEGNDAPAPKRTAQQRIDDLTREKHEERRRNEALEREIETLRPKPAPAAQPAANADDEPDPADPKYQFGETDPLYIKDLGAHAARTEFNRLRNEDQQQSAVRSVQQADQDRRAAFAKDHPDFHDKIATDLVCTDVMADALIDSEVGPAVAYHLANNPDEARRIAALGPLAQIRAIGKIEAEVAKAAPAASTTRTVSDAPPVPPTIRGAGGKFGTSPDTEDFAAFERLADSKG
jgi:hypothetical protein